MVAPPTAEIVSPGNAMQRRIDTARLVLEPLGLATATAVIDGDLSSLDAAEGWPHEDTFDAMATALQPGGGPGWLITLEGRVIGDCGAFSWPDRAGVVEIGYGLSASFRGHGWATEAIDALCTWLFSEAGAVRITVDVLTGNVASRMVLEKLGFTITGESGEEVSYELIAPGDR